MRDKSHSCSWLGLPPAPTRGVYIYIYKSHEKLGRRAGRASHTFPPPGSPYSRPLANFGAARWEAATPPGGVGRATGPPGPVPRARGPPRAPAAPRRPAGLPHFVGSAEGAAPLEMGAGSARGRRGRRARNGRCASSPPAPPPPRGRAREYGSFPLCVYVCECVRESECARVSASAGGRGARRALAHTLGHDGRGEGRGARGRTLPLPRPRCVCEGGAASGGAPGPPLPVSLRAARRPRTRGDAGLAEEEKKKVASELLRPASPPPAPALFSLQPAAPGRVSHVIQRAPRRRSPPPPGRRARRRARAQAGGPGPAPPPPAPAPRRRPPAAPARPRSLARSPPAPGSAAANAAVKRRPPARRPAAPRARRPPERSAPRVQKHVKKFFFNGEKKFFFFFAPVSADAAEGGNSRGSGLAAPQAAPGAGAPARGRAPGARGEARSVRSFPPRSPLICLCVDPDPPAPGRGDPAAARAEELPEALSPPRRCPGLTLREAQSRPVPVRLSLAPALSLWSSMYCNGCESGSQTQPPHSLRSVTLLSSQRRAYWLPPTHGARSLARYLPLS